MLSDYFGMFTFINNLTTLLASSMISSKCFVRASACPIHWPIDDCITWIISRIQGIQATCIIAIVCAPVTSFLTDLVARSHLDGDPALFLWAWLHRSRAPILEPPPRPTSPSEHASVRVRYSNLVVYKNEPSSRHISRHWLCQYESMLLYYYAICAICSQGNIIWQL